MKLLSSAASPFGSKVKIWAHLLGVSDQIEIQMVDTVGLANSDQHHNTLGKIPCLVDGSRTIFDSAVICEHLAEVAKDTTGLPQSLDEKILLALINGLTEAALLAVYEDRMHPAEHQSHKLLAMQHKKIDKSLDALEQEPAIATDTLTGAALAAALGYLDLRLGGEWRDTRPNLAQWLQTFSHRHTWYAQVKPKA